MKLTKAYISAVISFLIPVLAGCQNASSTNENSASKAGTENTATKTGNAERLAIKLIPVAQKLTSPVGLEGANDGSGRLFVVSQEGKIYIIKNGKVLPEPFLDIKSKLDKPSPGYSEKGLLGLAFHPDYKTNKRFFVYYSAPSKARGSDHKSVVAEYHASASNPDKAETTESILLEFEQPESNHNGGQLAFGPDGMLYIGSGDGGGAGDKHGETGNGQNLNTLLGKILRIDVNTKSRYAAPPDNPFRNKQNAKPEIWAYGLRNPWRFSFDKQTGQLFCADVGQNQYEEINIIEKGKNYGWRIMEATHCFNPETNCNQKGLVLPIFEYSHSTGISVTGGFVYRGTKHKTLQGNYFFGDWNGRLFAISKTGNSWKEQPITLPGKTDNNVGININSFGQDEQGELYVVGQDRTGPYSSTGAIYRIGL